MPDKHDIEDLEKRIEQLEKTNANLQRQVTDSLRVIDVLVAVGKLKQGHVEEARQIVCSLSE